MTSFLQFLKRTSALLRLAMITKGFLIIFLTALVIFGYLWILLLIFVESMKLAVICALWRKFKFEEKVRAAGEYFKMTQLFTVVDELSRIQYENEIQNSHV